MSNEMRKLSVKHLLMDALNTQDIIGDDEKDLQADCLRELAEGLEKAWNKHVKKME